MKYNSWIASDRRFLKIDLFVPSISLVTINGILIFFDEKSVSEGLVNTLVPLETFHAYCRGYIWRKSKSFNGTKTSK